MFVVWLKGSQKEVSVGGLFSDQIPLCLSYACLGLLGLQVCVSFPSPPSPPLLPPPLPLHSPPLPSIQGRTMKMSSYSNFYYYFLKNFRLLMQSHLFVLPIFQWNFQISQKQLTVLTIFYKFLHSHCAPKGAPACAMTSKSYALDLRKMTKISAKMTKWQLSTQLVFQYFNPFPTPSPHMRLWFFLLSKTYPKTDCQGLFSSVDDRYMILFFLKRPVGIRRGYICSNQSFDTAD